MNPSDAPPMPPNGAPARLAFGVMSAMTPAPVVAQLCQALAPYPVLVHHDFSQQPDFAIDLPNVSFVKAPMRTGWNTWGFAQAILHTMDQALERLDFDWFQIVSDNALPVRPVAEFAQWLSGCPHDALLETVNLTAEPLARLANGYRVYTPRGTIAHRLLWSAHRMAFPQRAPRRLVAGQEIPLDVRRGRGGRQAARVYLARLLLRAARGGLFGPHPFGSALKPMIGAPWLTATPAVMRFLLRRAETPTLRAWLEKLDLPSETTIATLLGNSSYRLGPCAMYTPGYDGGSVLEMTPERVHSAVADGRFFARKFAADPNDPLRRELLATLGVSPDRVDSGVTDS